MTPESAPLEDVDWDNIPIEVNLEAPPEEPNSEIQV
jgi:hypothetical protein